MAVPDPHNSQRRESEALFHTRHVAEARLHPSSVLVGAEVPPTAREVLVYTTLLETHKLYVTNLVRAPGTLDLKALLGFSDCLDFWSGREEVGAPTLSGACGGGKSAELRPFCFSLCGAGIVNLRPRRSVYL